MGKDSESFYGALKVLNPVEPTPEVITGDIDTTSYNRIPELNRSVMAWVDEANTKSTLLDPPLEVVIIGVGNTAYLRESNILHTYGSPQVTEVLIALSAIKNRRVNLTLIDRNQKSLAAAINIDGYELSPYFQGTQKDSALCPQLKKCLERVTIFDETTRSYKIDKRKLKHIKINTFCADVVDLNFPPHKSDLIIHTFVLQYLESNKLRRVFCDITNSLKPLGKIITTDAYDLYQPACYAVLELPEASRCEKDIIYLKLDTKKQTLRYCFFSEKEGKVVKNVVPFTAQDKSKVMLDISLEKNPQSICLSTLRKIIGLIGYSKHNVALKDERHIYCNKRRQKINSVLFFTSVLNHNPSIIFSQNSLGKESYHSWGPDIVETTAHPVRRYGRFSEF